MEQSFAAKYKWLMAAGGILLGCFLVWYFNTIVFYILGAAAVSLLGAPIVKLIESIPLGSAKIPRWLSAALTLFLLLMVFCYLFMAFVPMISKEISVFAGLDSAQIKAALELTIGNFDSWVNSNLPNVDFSVKDAIADHIHPIIEDGFFTGFLGGITGFMIDTMVAIFTISFISFFFLKDDKLFTSGVVMLFPKKYEDNILRAIASSVNLLGRYFIGICLESIIKFVLVGFSLYFLGMQFSTAMIIGIVTAVLNVIPYIGPLIGALLSFLVAAVSASSCFPPEPIWDCFMEIAIVLIIFQLIDNVILQPYIYSSSVKAHPLEIFLVILMAGYVGGVVGMLFAIPSYTVIRVFAKEFLNGMRVVQKLTENL